MSEPSNLLDRPGALAELNHELKTPLAAIVGFADAMRARAFGPLDEKYLECAETIHAAATHLTALVDNLTDLAGVEAGGAHFERIDARALAEESLRLFALRAENAGITLDARLPDGVFMANADPLALRQILINLLANALAATPRGGQVSVTLARAAGDLVLSVEDTGPGVGAQEGLGLKLVRALCALHGGDFNLGASPGGGAQARVRLPVLAKD